jgi:hypothetical protein
MRPLFPGFGYIRGSQPSLNNPLLQGLTMLTQPQLKRIEMRGTSGPVGSTSVHQLAGIRIFVHKAQPRYELPEWLLPPLIPTFL